MGRYLNPAKPGHVVDTMNRPCCRLEAAEVEHEILCYRHFRFQITFFCIRRDDSDRGLRDVKGADHPLLLSVSHSGDSRCVDGPPSSKPEHVFIVVVGFEVVENEHDDDSRYYVERCMILFDE